ncbi:hypothetical protein UFOVP1357_46 [uncultured Caudovirales phage]|uniref:Uncharacterized protein n=1 Tax=uncultured Caudovirales phage TaxID=2100421 RepID=A0A6J5LE30_9CAUD|nr:hypothetical protein UFOVP18_26 [uncultured Caudovirales phage]CAB4126841.1 hypothetical protein UFOVP82_28 [uncultured Caudovirales phage]CAB4132441.1 hypothetical protein UFOVP258_19 [uncultured Caudovirales phage]CAB4146336.1 hypothetical protein UFOVP502_11 [uncultured Caudovirales phage]CAB4200447.1 hypothetical protein UFOVP1357_46 [uncultured Caudovirales phage]
MINTEKGQNRAQVFYDLSMYFENKMLELEFDMVDAVTISGGLLLLVLSRTVENEEELDRILESITIEMKENYMKIKSKKDKSWMN